MNSIDHLIEHQSNMFIDLSKLQPGTVLNVKTAHTLYEITLLDKNSIKIKGGKYFPQEKEVKFSGSTWGGSTIWKNRIGWGMHMEISHNPPKFILTSPVYAVRVSKDDWFYDLDWPNPTLKT